MKAKDSHFRHKMITEPLQGMKVLVKEVMYQKRDSLNVKERCSNGQCNLIPREQLQIRVVATTPEKTHNQKFLTFETILNRFLVQFYPGLKKKKKKLPPLYIDQLKCGIRPDPRPPTPDPPDPTLFGKPLCEKTERDRDMKISGFVDLDTADALKYVKI